MTDTVIEIVALCKRGVILMYSRVEGSPRMSRNEACLAYPDSYVLMQKVDRDMLDSIGLVLYVGDDGDELFSLQVNLPVPMGVVIEGINLQRSLGGIVVGE